MTAVELIGGTEQTKQDREPCRDTSRDRVVDGYYQARHIWDDNTSMGGTHVMVPDTVY